MASVVIVVKRGVVLAALHDEKFLEPACVFDTICHDQGWGHCRITAGIDGNHAEGSYHYCAGKQKGQAIDLGLPTQNEADIQLGLKLLRASLDPKRWIVVLEKDHLHIQPPRVL